MKTPGLLSSLRHRDFAHLMGAFATSTTGSWAYSVALVVWLVDVTGSPGWVAASTAARFVPALVVSAYGGVIAERFEQVRLLVTLDLVFTGLMVVMAVEMMVDAHPVAVVATATVASALTSVYAPAAAALTPRLVPEGDLGSANALRNTIDNTAVVAGPGLAGLLLVVAAPWAIVLLNAATFVVSASLLLRMRVRSIPVDVTEDGAVGPLHQMLVGVRTIIATPSTATLVAFSLIATVVFGIDTVLLVILSEQVLGTGAEGFGYLLAGLGLGGVLAATLVTRLERLPRLGTVILLGMAAYCLPTLLFLVVDSPTVGFGIQCFRGGATLVVDVLAVTALQRSVPSDRLARVFGAFDGLMILAVLLGSTMVPLLMETTGLTGAIVFSGFGVPLLCLLGLPWLRRMDQQSTALRAALRPKITLLQRCSLFADVREGALEQLAGVADLIDVEPGSVIVRQGDPTDAFYVIEAGEYAVSAVTPTGSVVAPDMRAGDYFGEIGLLEAIPRTATVTARGVGRLLRVDGAALVTALTQHTPSPALLDGAACRLQRTHPHLVLSAAALDRED